MSSHNTLKIEGLKENNLRSLDLEIPHNAVTVVCGPSGSGKSTLAFDAVYAEGARRYVETFDPYTRQFLDRLKAPDASLIENVRPSLALEQRNRVTSSRSTVGTVTEINDYLKVLWAHVSELECPSCKKIIKQYSPELIIDCLSNLSQNAKNYLLSFKIEIKKGSLSSHILNLKALGFSRYLKLETKEVNRIEDLDPKSKITELFVVVDRVSVKDLNLKDKKIKSRLLSSLSQCYEFGKKDLQVFIESENKELEQINFSNKYFCGTCNLNFKTPSPSLFTFNSPIGACDECKGFGKVLKIDPLKCIPDQSLSIKEGAINCWSGELGKKQLLALKKFSEEHGISLDVPWEKLSQKNKDLIFNGATPKDKNFKGINPWFDLVSQKRHKMHVRIFVAKHRSEFTCPSCNGSRLVSDSLYFKVNNKNIGEVSNLPMSDLEIFIKQILVSDELLIIKNEILSRLNYLNQVGLPYLTLDRQTKTLSGGEFQRVNLTTLLGANLVNSMFVLDEPTIGLHPRDTKKLISAIKDLSEKGNTLLVVEHDPEVISEADNLIELGPDSGSQGGEIVYQGKPQGIVKANTKTAKYFNNINLNQVIVKKELLALKSNKISIRDARVNNLKSISVDIPLDCFVVLGGVSGSGKSTLLHDCLYRAYQESGSKSKISTDYVKVEGLDKLNEIVLIDQQPIGKSSRANPATYTKIWDDFREYFAETEASQSLGLTKSSFSFNVDGGRCPICQGNGSIKIEMQFLTDVKVECEACLGQRFRDQILGISLGGKNVLEVLHLPIQDVPVYLENLPNEKRNNSISQGIQPLLDLGLGYLTLGQSLSDLSGGEAQRLKLASYLRSKSKNNLFILDEPTTGLHPNDIDVLLIVLHKIVSAGNSVICIEHNLDVIRNSHWFIELGPEGGEGGGQLIIEGNPQKLFEDRKKNSPTLKSLREELKLEKSKLLNKVSKIDKSIKIKGAREHNLKDISVDIPENQLCVITGLSGSGKSTLAFDILFSEGQRRFIDCLSPYARQYISQEQKPDVDLVDNLPPTVAVSQKIAPPSGISTLATVTEIYQFLRLLYSKVGTQHCTIDGEVIANFTQDFIVEEIVNKYEGKVVHVFAPVVMGRKGHYRELFDRALKADLSHARIDNEYKSISEDLKLERHKLHWISLEIGKLKVSSKNKEMLHHAIAQALLMSQGNIEITLNDPYTKPKIYSLDRVCPKCKTGYLPLDPQDFSFRSARGMCTRCHGSGKLEILGQRKTKVCPECSGARVGEIARNVKINGKAINELTKFKAPELKKFFKAWKYDQRLAPVIDPILKELIALLEMIEDIGLSYLTLDRDASTLSGGEAQRLRLAKNLGAPLTGVCYVLDEPSIGLHAADHGKLMQTLKKIRDQGNTVIVVEHDEDTILASDYVIDVGPEAGVNGGNIVYSGPLKNLFNCEESKTAQAFKEQELCKVNNKNDKFIAKEYFSLNAVSTNNLKDVAVDFPVNCLISVVGVSGAGKSSLVYGTLVPAVIEELEGEEEREKFYDKTWLDAKGLDAFDKMIEIDQKPIGKTPASTPASFLGLFNEIRKLFESLPEAKIRGFNAAHFSYNTGKGKCQTCEGRGYVKIPMSFLPDAMSECEACNSYRYNEETLEVKYNGYSIGDILKLTMSEAREVLSNFSKIKNILDHVCDLGIGYLSLGQASHTLSGGEAQRLKIVREISSSDTGSSLYILDEPTIGLHMLDVKRLISVLRKLVEKGNTVIVIEHNFDVILSSDYVVDIGPGPGDLGGNVLYQGSMFDFLKSKHNSPTLKEIKK